LYYLEEGISVFDVFGGNLGRFIAVLGVVTAVFSAEEFLKFFDGALLD